jgi:DNA-binding transcriptional MerR regulator
MKCPRLYRINEAARIAGISARTLRHYEEIGLLMPKQRSAAAYRLYDDAALLRLQQILIGRELGLSLEQIRHLLDDPGFDLRRALRTQREQLRQAAERTEAMMQAIDAALAALEDLSGEPMDPKAIFRGFSSSPYAQEAQQRWGESAAYEESARRTAGYGAEDWARFNAEQTAIFTDAAAAMAAGRAPTDEDAHAIAERHRLLIDRWFYPCSVRIHCSLADLFESDARFARTFDSYGQGLATYFAALIRANAEESRDDARS